MLKAIQTFRSKCKRSIRKRQIKAERARLHREYHETLFLLFELHPEGLCESALQRLRDHTRLMRLVGCRVQVKQLPGQKPADKPDIVERQFRAGKLESQINWTLKVEYVAAKHISFQRTPAPS